MGIKKTQISIVVPVYNSAKYLEECIGSLLAQTYEPYEIILVDDGSFDGSGEICDEFATHYSHIKVIHKKNGGVSSARNKGIEEAKGSYLIFVDADDALNPKMLEFYALYMDKDGVPICNIVEVNESESIDANKGVQFNIEVETFEQFMKLFSDDYINSPCNKLYDLKILRQYNIKFLEKVSLGEDLLFNLNYLQYSSKKYYICTDPLYYYRKGNAESLSSCFRLDLFDMQLYMFRELKDFLENMKILSKENRDEFIRIFWNRMYLTADIYRQELRRKKDPKIERIFYQLLRHPIWKSLWKECKKEKVVTYKMLIKRFRISFWKFSG